MGFAALSRFQFGNVGVWRMGFAALYPSYDGV